MPWQLLETGHEAENAVDPKEATFEDQELESFGKEVEKGQLKGRMLARRTFPHCISRVAERDISGRAQAELTAVQGPVVGAHGHQRPDQQAGSGTLRHGGGVTECRPEQRWHCARDSLGRCPCLES